MRADAFHAVSASGTEADITGSGTGLVAIGLIQTSDSDGCVTMETIDKSQTLGDGFIDPSQAPVSKGGVTADALASLGHSMMGMPI